ncbi:ABC transporter ATP-binding protein [Alicyclobacillus fastidiosus]|uniref:ABC transporter ATP-binding protein n=1 Tax=Alicyclobacillus fastidiosus TaxID=392011 RepID=A0ABY6ZGW9_9BACL|nr:ABC transporter ATP-binding protein [Alicyclobacillus fastidiosus]WAH41375.1 ABC transporter ATP-binding protein [Alicyclobacillus fastidiosus]GMA62989.1 ABC transporter ATP-binding protein [Alicyclobacillus fastidiosus]
MSRTPVLEVNNLSVGYQTTKGVLEAVRKVDFSVYENEVVGLIGESGSGKSTLAYAIMRLLKNGAHVTEGSVKVLGQDLYNMDPETLRTFRWSNISMVFQSAMNALNPVMTVEQQIIDTLRFHDPSISKKAALELARELFRLVRIDPSRLKSYPHELSGGMRQRVIIAIAIALNPKFVIMDEPTTALDVVVQKSILDQIMELKERLGFSILFISHDFSLVSEIADRVAVMYCGRLVEVANSGTLSTPDGHHPYTEGLIHAIPRFTDKKTKLRGIPGTPPALDKIPSGCSFHPRCKYAEEVCSLQAPPIVKTEKSIVECHFHAKVGEHNG